MGFDTADLARLGPKARSQVMRQLMQQREDEKSRELPKQSKFNNVKTVVDGIRFDSKREAERFRELMEMQKAGLVRNLLMI